MSDEEIIPLSEIMHITFYRKQQTIAKPGEYMLVTIIDTREDHNNVYDALFSECGASEDAINQLSAIFHLHGNPWTTENSSVRDEKGEEIFGYETRVEFNQAAAEVLNDAEEDKCDTREYVVDLDHGDATKPIHKTFLEEETARKCLMDCFEGNVEFVHNGTDDQNPKFSTENPLGRLSYMAVPRGEMNYILTGVIRKIAVDVGTRRVKVEYFERNRI